MSTLKDLFIGKKYFQSLFERLHRISLRGMNYGLGGTISSSGELNLLKYVNKELEDTGHPILIDVGANDGKYISAMQTEFNNRALIYGFEPSASAFSLLENKWNDQDNIRLFQYGLAAEEGEMNLYFNEEGSGWASVYQRQGSMFNKDLSRSETIKLIRLDDFCRDNDIEHIDFMKIDVEGFELSVLQGAKEILEKTRFVQFEFSFANYDAATYLKDFFEIMENFKIYRVLQNGIHELQYDPRYEILMTTNYLAINTHYIP
jgi:FkbM family methyltransferase